MAGVQFIRHQDIEILYVDFSYCASKEEILRIIEETKTAISTRPPGTVFTLTNITKAYFDSDISQALKGLTTHNKPYVKAGAVVGLTDIRRIIYNAVLFFSKRHLEVCDDLESAKAWLVTQSREC
jgi:hypothetical protein